MPLKDVAHEYNCLISFRETDKDRRPALMEQFASNTCELDPFTWTPIIVDIEAECLNIILLRHTSALT